MYGNDEPFFNDSYVYLCSDSFFYVTLFINEYDKTNNVFMKVTDRKNVSNPQEK